ncbi:CTP synthase 1 [Lepeophtheirus salmonis]|uniref:CTP synthase n=1 Tax=Lepeophtheirus salmonis TaxID=72036 RepID=A0A0K2UX45_LEPSM|nr:CTP synthase 1-like [Lepeophtheirus salmonis]
MKYILVTGGVISGIGKGVIASSVGVILKNCGLSVTSIKIDPYINIDAGTFSPYEHGEVYVLNDGGEVDLDLGNYERFLDLTLKAHNNITTGKIYQEVITKERRGDYLGKTVQVVPHVTDAIQEWITKVAKISVDPECKDEPEVCIIELGGTIGDIEGMPFIEALRQFQFNVGSRNFCSIHVSLVPQPHSTGEQKTKPTQQSVRELRGLGISPDVIVCRSENPISDSIKLKISNFCHVATDRVISIPDCSNIYEVPIVLCDQSLVKLLGCILNLTNCGRDLTINRFMSAWSNLTINIQNLHKEVSIVIVGKYTLLEDAYASVKKSLEHASFAAKYKLKLTYVLSSDLEENTLKENPVKYHNAWMVLCKCQGVVVPGGFGARGLEGKIAAARWARKNKVPFLGICLGLQIAAIEFARNVLNLKNANSTETDSNTPHPIVIDMPEHTEGDLGGTMRLGLRRTIFKRENSLMKKLYGDVDFIEERHRHRYEINPEYVQQFEEKGMVFVGQDTEATRMEIMELKDHPFYVAVQYHPEYLSRPLKPSPPFFGLILASIGKLQDFLNGDFKISRNWEEYL